MAWCGARVATPAAVDTEVLPASDPRVVALRAAVGWVEAVALRTASQVEANPVKSRVGVASFVLAGLIFGSAAPAGALSWYEPFENMFTTDAWFSNSIAFATKLFFLLFVTTIAYQIVIYGLENRTLAGIGPTIARTMLVLGIPFALINGTTALVLGSASGGSITSIAGSIASNITGRSAGSPVTLASTATTFAGLAWSLPVAAWKLVTNTGIMDLIHNPWALPMAYIVYCFTVIVAVFILLLGVFIAAEMLMALIRINFGMPLILWQLGFYGAPGTANMASSVWTAFIRLMVNWIALLLIQAQAIAIVTKWTEQVSKMPFNSLGNPGQDGGLIKTSIVLLLGCAVLGLIAANIPAFIAGAITGAPTLSGVSVVSGAASGAASAVGGGIGAGIKVAAQASAGARTAQEFQGPQSDVGAARKGLERGGAVGAVAALIANRRK